MKMCLSCKELYPDGDSLTFCPRRLAPTLNASICNGALKKVECLKCEDTGEVTILDPRVGPETKACPNGCRSQKEQA